MQLANKGSLDKLIKSRETPLSEAEMLPILVQVAHALEYLHEEVKVIHRDVKAENVLLFEHGFAKLADFGVSKQLENTLAGALTLAGTDYMLAPEIVKRESYTSKVDVWSFAVLIYYMATKETHVDYCTLYALALKGDPIPLLPESYSQLLRELVAACLSLNPNDRPTIKEILDGELFRDYRYSYNV